MKIDTKDIKFWMDAIRNSDDRDRTLESFWGGQLESKAWLVETVEQFNRLTNANIVIHGGWNGVLASMLFNSGIGIRKITSVDIDPACEDVAKTINMRQHMEGKFTAVTADMCTYEYNESPNMIINTSCEHITQEQYSKWLQNVPNRSKIIVQSNDYFELDEHINCSKDLKEFESKSELKIYKSAELKLPKYNRFMIVGYK
tara:strand:- start:12012 stop:12614 length:603 start_codon:yes stop_codon:yes gene_type:complete